MTGMVDWAASRARMVIAFIFLSIVAGAAAYIGLPKEGEPDIEIPALFVSVQFPGISAIDSESLLVKPMETELADLDGLKSMSSTAAEGYAGVVLEFEFGWDNTADVRDAMNTAQAVFPDGAEQYSLAEFNFSEFPIVIVNLTGKVPERTMTRIAKDLQDDIEGLDAVLEAGLAGNRDEMVEVIIDPLRLEAYNVTAAELITVVQNNNQLIAAGEIDSAQGSFSVKIPSSFDSAEDIYRLPVKTNGDRVITLGDLAQINFTFEDREGTARFNGDNTVALQVVKRKGYNIIDTVALIEETVAKARSAWPPELQAAVQIGTSNDQSRQVGSMVRQLEGSVLTAIALVMIVVLSALGSRAAMLVGFAIPTSFLLCFVLLAIMGVTISNIVMFGLILAVGMLVDGAIVVVEYADKRIKEGSGPMHAYVEAAQRMFWPIISSTATTLCAFLPMLFWPGRVHGDAAGYADLCSVGLSDRGADLPAGDGWGVRAAQPQFRRHRRNPARASALGGECRAGAAVMVSDVRGCDADHQPVLSGARRGRSGAERIWRAALCAGGVCRLDHHGRRADRAQATHQDPHHAGLHALWMGHQDHRRQPGDAHRRGWRCHRFCRHDLHGLPDQ